MSHDSMRAWKKIFFTFVNILCLITLLGVIISSSTLIAISPGSQTYLTIWTNSKPTVFKAFDVTYLENPVSNLTLKDLEVIKWEDIIDKQTYEVQNHSKVAVVLNNKPLKPSSPKRFPFTIPTLIIRKDDREEFVKMTNNASKEDSIQISKECKKWNNYKLPEEGRCF